MKVRSNLAEILPGSPNGGFDDPRAMVAEEGSAYGSMPSRRGPCRRSSGRRLPFLLFSCLLLVTGSSTSMALYLLRRASFIRTLPSCPSYRRGGCALWAARKRAASSSSPAEPEAVLAAEEEAGEAAGPWGGDSEDAMDLSHLSRSKHLHPYWLRRLSMLHRPSARALVSQLVPDNPLAFDAGPTLAVRRGTLFDYVLSQKRAHPDKVILTRVGEFYETYGVDALMMIEYAGLNPMGNKAKAGCPVRNIQATLDGLTGAGLTVAVVEEVNELDGLTARSKIKSRVLSQVVSPGSSTYLYDCCLRPDDVEFKENRPYVGLLKAPLGYMVVELFLDARVMRVTERLTEEAVRTSLEASGLAEPLYVQGVGAELLRAVLPSSEMERRDLSGHDSHTFPTAVLRSVARDLEADLSDMRTITTPTDNRPRPIYLATAQQIGVLPNPNVPDLIRALLPAHHAAHSARFWRRWLLAPPPYHLADAMQQLCTGLAQVRRGVPQCRPVPVGKLVSMLSLRQCNVPLFRDVAACLQAMHAVLTAPGYSSLVAPLMSVVAYESGIDVARDALVTRSQAVLEEISGVICRQDDDQDPVLQDPRQLIPQVFFDRNEEVFRGCVQRGSHAAVEAAYQHVQACQSALCRAVEEDFPPECEIVVDQINNAVMLKKRPATVPAKAAAAAAALAEGKDTRKRRRPATSEGRQQEEGEVYILPTDRNHKPIAKRYTTARVESAIADYVSSVEEATAAVRQALQDLSVRLKEDLLVLVTALHVAVVLQAATAHVAAARHRGWTMPELLPPDTQDWTMRVEGLMPYWMDQSRGVGNSLDLRGIFLLTAPNMSGKSTLMRAVTVAALLANCGCMVPAKRSSVPRFDNLFMRTASFDVPAEGKSAFALEMDDVRVMLRDCSRRSLVMLDEIGKGTSARDGAALSGALLEAMDGMGVTAVFATHLHEMFDLPLQTRTVSWKRMGYVEQEDGRSLLWTYRLEDGRCTSSMAMQTARAYGIPPGIIERAEQLGHVFDHVCRPPTAASNGGVVMRTPEPPSLTDLPPPPPTLELRPPPSLQAATSVLLRLVNEGRRNRSPPSGVNSSTGSLVVTLQEETDVFCIDHDQAPPPGLEGSSCLYILSVSSGAQQAAPLQGDDDEAGAALYVGETDGLRKRLAQHRKRMCVKSAVVVPLADKTEARAVEAALIRELVKAGYPLLSDRDGLRANQY